MKFKKKKFQAAMSFFVFFIFFFCFQNFSSAFDNNKKENNTEEIYKNQLENSGANKLKESLPEETAETLEKIGVDRVDWRQLMALTPDRIFFQIFKMIKKIAPAPIKSIFYILSIVLICSLLDNLKTPLEKHSFRSILSAVSCLCISVAIVMPMVGFIEKASIVIKSSSGFMLSYIPIMGAILLSEGKGVSASSYQVLMMGITQVISQIASNVLVPMLNSLLAISLVSSISRRISVEGVCRFFYKIIKWVLSLSMTTFASLLTLQSIVGASVDNIGSKAAKFIISSFVPVVGGALSDAFTTVRSCVKLLKSSVGAFGIIAGEFIFLPIIIEAMLWLFSIYLCSAISDIFNLGKISNLLANSARVISMVLSVVMSCVILLIISSVIVLTISDNIST
ncbi:MAG: stage III sporulation protein AE [Oscillospiraceae bacterium]|jgi:stage III sporulation protein AE|nr:stage III sporulation protein AE [Oscillospiraceae bacterium]